jgi:hypothetical protein
MSENVNRGGVGVSADVTLPEFSAALRARYLRSEYDPGLAGLDYVLVERGSDIVLAHFQGRAAACDELNRRFDEDPGAVEKLRLVELVGGEVTREEWPRRGSALERARALVRELNSLSARAYLDVESLIRCFYLRGCEVTERETPCGYAVWWMSAEEVRFPVGLIVEAEAGEYILLADERTPALSESEVLRRLAEATTAFTGEPVGTEQLEHVLDEERAGLTPTTRVLARFAINVAQRFGLIRGEARVVAEEVDD